MDYTAQRIKIADFGAAELLEEKRRSSDRIHGDVGAGTLAYNPPEVRERFNNGHWVKYHTEGRGKGRVVVKK